MYPEKHQTTHSFGFCYFLSEEILSRESIATDIIICIEPFHCKPNSYCSRTLGFCKQSPSNPQYTKDSICCNSLSDRFLFVKAGRYAGIDASDAARLLFISLWSCQSRGIAGEHAAERMEFIRFFLLDYLGG